MGCCIGWKFKPESHSISDEAIQIGPDPRLGYRVVAEGKAQVSPELKVQGMTLLHGGYWKTVDKGQRFLGTV